MAKKVKKEVDLTALVVEGMQEKKAHDITIVDLTKIKGAVTDYFVICSATSDTQAEAICDSVEDFVRKHSGQTPWHREGIQQKEWILLDYVDVVAHIFKKDRRSFYSLEELWGDAKITFLEEGVLQAREEDINKEVEVKKLPRKVKAVSSATSKNKKSASATTTKKTGTTRTKKK